MRADRIAIRSTSAAGKRTQMYMKRKNANNQIHNWASNRSCLGLFYSNKYSLIA